MVTIGHYFAGGMARGPYATEPARLEIILLGMQGLGKPGVHQAQIAYLGMPKNVLGAGRQYMDMFNNLATSAMGDRLLKPHKGTPLAWGKQLVPKTLIEDAIKKGTVDFWGTGGHEEPAADQYKKYTYPIPADQGGTEIHMMWTDTPCRVTCWNCGNDVCEAMLSPKIECIVAQHPWLENDCLYADVILPTNTTLEVNDIMLNLRDGDSFQTVINMRKAIEPVGESKSDYEAVCAVAEKLGMLDEVTDGFSEAELIKGVFDGMGFDKLVSWEEFEEKDYLVVPYETRLAEAHGRLVRLLPRPRRQPHTHAHRQAGVLLREPGQGLPPRRGTPRHPQVDREGHHPRRAPRKQAGPGLSPPGHVQPRSLAGPRPVRRHPLEQGSGHRQGPGLRRLPVRALLDAPEHGGRAGHQERRYRQECTTNGGACCAALWCSSASCPGCFPSTTGPGPTTSSRRGWTAVGPSTPSLPPG